MEKLKDELERFYENKVNGLIIRSRARWHEHGEKNSKYFLNLEKRNSIRKHIRKLYLSGVLTTDPFKILDAQQHFYKHLYSSRKTNLNCQEAAGFLNESNIPKLTKELSDRCEGEIKIQECEEVLQSFATAKTPGNDGIPIEFYKTFWPAVGKLLVESLNEAFNKKKLSASQRKAIITLIEKKDKDRCFLENWRPISLLNVDSKIASKVISARIIKVLPTIIHFNQTGCVKGRYIGEATKSILDIMTYTKQTSKSGVFLFIDFEKAFDSIE